MEEQNKQEQFKSEEEIKARRERCRNDVDETRKQFQKLEEFYERVNSGAIVTGERRELLAGYSELMRIQSDIDRIDDDINEEFDNELRKNRTQEEKGSEEDSLQS